MRTVLILGVALLVATLLFPMVASATITAGTANPYHVKTVGIEKRVARTAGTTIPWTLAVQTDSTDFMLKSMTALVAAQPETTNAISVKDMIYPAAGQIYAGVFMRAATADSVIVQPQISQDGLYWTSLANVSLVGTIDFDPLTEAATTITTPMWNYMRWILWAAETDKAVSQVSTAGVRMWFSYYEKDR